LVKKTTKGNNMINGEHWITSNIKTAKGFENFEENKTVTVKMVDRKKGLYEVKGKGIFHARKLKGILAPIKEEKAA
jgi:hypothetical protein